MTRTGHSGSIRRAHQYAIRSIGTSGDFLAGFEDNGEPVWVDGWTNPKMLQWPIREQTTQHLHLVFKAGFHAMIEEVETKRNER